MDNTGKIGKQRIFGKFYDVDAMMETPEGRAQLYKMAEKDATLKRLARTNKKFKDFIVNYKVDDNIEFEVTCSREKDMKNNEILKITIRNIKDDDVNLLKDELLKNESEDKLTTMIFAKGDYIKIVLYKTNLQAWMDRDIDLIVKTLENTGHYSDEQIENLTSNLFLKIEDGSSSKGERMKSYNESLKQAIDMWKTYLAKLDDPETIEILKQYAQFAVDKKYGHVLSLKNALIIRSRDIGATFILPPNEWRKLNRGIRRGAKRFVVYVPSNNKYNINAELKNIIKESGWGNTPFYKLPPQVKKMVDIKMKQQLADVFVPVYEYDIKDTYVLKGKEDLFNTTMGLKNNLTGELNDIARQDAGPNKNKSEWSGNDLMLERTREANEVFSKYCENEGIKYKTSENPSENLVNALEAKYYDFASMLDILKPENKKIFAENATHITLLFTGIAYDQLNRFSHGFEYSNKEVGEMIDAVSEVVDFLTRNMQSVVSESKTNINENAFTDKFLKIFKQIGCTIKKDTHKLNESHLRKIIKETLNKYVSLTLNEKKTLIDNFDKIKEIIGDTNDGDAFYFVQIIKRFKDNPNMDKSGNYHAGGEYLQSWKIFSYDELLKLKGDIINACETNNARAYITINPRSDKQIKGFLSTFRKRFRPNDPRYIHAEEILAGQTKGHWDNRPFLFLDIDTTDKKVWNGVDDILKRFGIKEVFRYTTPSGGLHIVLPDKDAQYMKDIKYLFNKFDNYRNRGRLATVHPNDDGKIILYSNVDTKGY